MNKPLGEFFGSRDNNFNLLRFIAASVVLFSHSYPLALGSGSSGPIKNAVGLSGGWIAVDVFFITSGFLIAGSLHFKRSLWAFLWARVLRIYPGLLVSLVLSTIVIGFFFTNLSIKEFFLDSETHRFVIQNFVLFFNEYKFLPGAFEDAPLNSTVNGSLWTLPFEVRSYVLLVLFSIVLSNVKLLSNDRNQRISYAVVSIAGLVAYLLDQFLEILPIWYFANEDLRFYSLFFLGSSAFFWRDRIILSTRWFLVALTVLSLSAVDKSLFFVVYNSVLVYLVLYLAYVPSGIVRAFNRIGDYSYGIYIYAWPVQQTVVITFAGISVYGLFLAPISLHLYLPFSHGIYWRKGHCK